MKKYLSILFAVVTAASLFTACTRVDDLPYYSEGAQTITLTADKTSVTPMLADSNNAVVKFTWTDPRYASDPATYKYVLEIDTAGNNFANKTTKTVFGEFGDSLTGRELNAIILNYGYAIGMAHQMEVRVVSSYNNNNERYISNVVNVAVTPFNDPPVFTSTSNSVLGTISTSSQHALDFNWTPSFPGYTGDINYEIEYDSAGKNFASPHIIAVGPNVLTKSMIIGDMNTTALDEGVEGGSNGTIEYRLKATTQHGAVTYSNSVSVDIQTYVPVRRFYLPGGYQGATGQGNDWDPVTAPELIRDLRPGALNRMYYIYVYLPANSEFKITEGRSWSVNYGDGGSGNLVPGGGNISVTTAGIYRISIDVANWTYDVRIGRMGFVGGAVTGVGWNPGTVFPTTAMGLPATNLFVGIHNFSVDEWKMIDNDQWDNGSMTITETRSYSSTGGSGSSLMVNNPANFAPLAAAGDYRVIWDGRNPDDVKYHISPADEMRLVGDGIDQAGVNDWDPASSPQMTYNGNGVWTITIALKANKEIKFLAGNAWGAFDYEDNSGGSQATGTPKSIVWDGTANFKTPATAGTYTITLNEYAQTVTIN